MPSGGGFRFGPYRLDPRSRVLYRDGVALDVKSRQFDVLHTLVRRAGELVTKDDLIRDAWNGVIVDDNSLTQAVSRLRHLPGAPEFDTYIVTVQGHGYRFVEPVHADGDAHSRESLLALLAPDRAWSDGLDALESFDPTRLVAARAMLRQQVAAFPREARFRIVLALVCAFVHDGTRTDAQPDKAALAEAENEACEACTLNPDLPEAWATLGFILERTGDRENAIAALQRATRLDPTNWQHHGRLASAEWGQARLRAVRDTLHYNKGFAMAHFFAASLWVAREAYDDAWSEVMAGVAAAESEAAVPARFRAVGLHYLNGLLCNVRGETDDALAAFAREVTLLARGHFYGRESAANSSCARGACLRRAGDADGARAAFADAHAFVPDHPLALAGVALLDGPGSEAALRLAAMPPRTFEHVMAQAAYRVHTGDVAGGVAMVLAALESAAPGNTGWTIPIDPLLDVAARRTAWAPVLELLHLRAR